MSFFIKDWSCDFQPSYRGEYADVVWNGCSESDSNLLESLKIEGTRVVIALKGASS